MADRFDAEKALLVVSLANLERSEVERQSYERWKSARQFVLLSVPPLAMATLGLALALDPDFTSATRRGGAITGSFVAVFAAIGFMFAIRAQRRSVQLRYESERRAAVLGRYLRESGYVRQLADVDSATAQLVADLGLFEFRDRWSPEPPEPDLANPGAAGLRVLYGPRTYGAAMQDLWASQGMAGPLCISATPAMIDSVQSVVGWPYGAQVLLRGGSDSDEMTDDVLRSAKAGGCQLRWDRNGIAAHVAFFAGTSDRYLAPALLTLGDSNDRVTVGLWVEPRDNPRLLPLISKWRFEFDRAWSSAEPV